MGLRNNLHALAERKEETGKLPLGHYQKTQASQAFKEAAEAVYGPCRAQEKALSKGLPRTITLEVAAKIAWHVCESLYVNPPAKIFFDSDKLAGWTSGHYNPVDRTIHLGRYHSTVTFLHELTHHVVNREKLSDDHGPNFLWVEQMVFEVARPYLTSNS